MCGRGVVHASGAHVNRVSKAASGKNATCGGKAVLDDEQVCAHNYNYHPGQTCPVLVLKTHHDGTTRVCELQNKQWGLVPRFTRLDEDEKPNFFKMFNARSESVDSKPSFKQLVNTHRGVVLFSGYYEWMTPPGSSQKHKQPYYVHRTSDEPLALAAIYDQCGELATFTILTTDSTRSAVSWLHDRMPVILRDDESIRKWMDVSQPLPYELLGPYTEKDLEAFKVTSDVGNMKLNHPRCCEPLKTKAVSESAIAKLFAKKKVASPTAKRERDDDDDEGAAAAAPESAKVKREKVD